MDTSLDEARRRDAGDPMSGVRSRFHLPPGSIYMDGNSLGPASPGAEAAVERVLSEWRTLGIGGWMAAARPWFTFAESLRCHLAPLVGAAAEDIIVTGTTTVNLHALLASFYEPSPGRRRIVATSVDFPSDIHAVQGQIRLRGGDPERDLVRVAPREDGLVAEDDLVDAMTDDVALVLLPSVLYHTGQLLDIQRIATEAQRRGVALGIDAAHGVGSVPHTLDRWGVDFAVWCSYKYLNGGPAAPAGLFVHRRHRRRLPVLAGWWGGDKDVQFDMDHAFIPALGAGRWQISAPAMLSLAPLEASLALFDEIGIDAIREASLSRTAYLIDLLDATGTLSASHGYRLATPREAHRRGGHVSVRHPDGARIVKALQAHGVVPDFRPPDLIRLAPVALYNTYEECWRVVQLLREIVVHGLQHAFPPGRGRVA